MRRLLLTAALIVQPALANADNARCDMLANDYATFLQSAKSALQQYGSCVGMSRGDDDCAAKWRAVKSIQSDLEQFVSSKTVWCKS